MKTLAIVLMSMITAAIGAGSLSGPSVDFQKKGRNRWEDVMRLHAMDFDGVPFPLEYPLTSNIGELVSIPSAMMRQYFYPVGSLPDGATIRLTCGPNLDGIGCEFFVNVYHCPSCSGVVNGGLVASMTAAGYEGRSCAPKVIVRSMTGEFKQPMVAFRIVIEADDFVLLPTVEGGARFIAIFASDIDDSCHFRSVEGCEEHPVCTLRDGTCSKKEFCPKTIHQKQQGPDAVFCTRNCLSLPDYVEEEEPSVQLLF